MINIKRFSVSGYKSIRELKDFELKPLNILIGANGAGKSNFIRFFGFLRAVVEKRLKSHIVIEEGNADAILHFGQKTTKQLDVDIQMILNDYDKKNRYKFSLVPTTENLLFAKEITDFDGILYAPTTNDYGQGHEEAKITESTSRVSQATADFILNHVQVYHLNEINNNINISCELNNNLVLLKDASNLAAYLSRLEKEYEHEYAFIVQTIQRIAPFFNRFVFRPDTYNPDKTHLEWIHNNLPDTPLKGRQLSDGTLRFICLTTLLLQPFDLMPDLLLIDEPELGLHPYAIHILAALIQRAAERKQVIITTQSPELINHFSAEDIIVAEQTEDGASTFKRLQSVELKKWLEKYSLSELWEMDMLGGNP